MGGSDGAVLMAGAPNKLLNRIQRKGNGGGAQEENSELLQGLAAKAIPEKAGEPWASFRLGSSGKPVTKLKADRTSNVGIDSYH